MNISIDEQETVIRYSRTENVASIWTDDSTVMTRLDKLVAAAPEYWSVENRENFIDGTTASITYKCTDKSLIGFRGKKRQMTDEQIEAARKRLAGAREKQNVSNGTDGSKDGK